MTTVICSHGFGVRADSRGMFPEIAAAFPGADVVMFDYTDIDDRGSTRVPGLQEQARRLQSVIDAHRGEAIVLLCHSQGCMIAGMVDLAHVRRVILLAPPRGDIMQRLLQRIAERPGSYHRRDGDSCLVRSDDSLSIISAQYIDEVAAVRPDQLYQQVVTTTPTVLVRATEDDVLGEARMTHLAGADYREVSADHNFSGKARQELIRVLRDYIAG
ncbi:MAG TPA: alpha/beta fold hydrolase [Candidatus Saccharimonas sp.]|jgi:pimeloyl-ACP methyl ester carboxylesterase|nr:alpha/beta fold hydrolase [Candidatus Saccharimonas sp.]